MLHPRIPGDHPLAVPEKSPPIRSEAIFSTDDWEQIPPGISTSAGIEI